MSKTALVKKLRIQTGQRVLIMRAFFEVRQVLGDEQRRAEGHRLLLSSEFTEETPTLGAVRAHRQALL